MATKTDLKKESHRNKNHFDVIVMGATLTGLITSYSLQKLGKKVLLIESKDEVGGPLTTIGTHQGSLQSSMSFVPATEENRELLSWLGNLLEENLVLSTQNHEAKTFSEGNLHRFLGFGNRPGHSLDELSYYNTTDCFELALSPTKWVEKLKELYTEEVIYKSELTDIIVENENITEVIINGAKKYSAKEYIYCDSPKKLLDLFAPFDSLSPKVRQKINKAHFWTQVSLHYSHPELISEDHNVHFLMGNKPDHDPCIGRFFPVRLDESGGATQDSFWTSFMPSEEADNDDHIGGVIRYMKKQIKRAYPHLQEKISNEKITVHPESHGELTLKLTHPGRLPKLKNFILASSFLEQKRNLPAQIHFSKSLQTEYWPIQSHPQNPPPDISPTP